MTLLLQAHHIISTARRGIGLVATALGCRMFMLLSSEFPVEIFSRATEVPI